VNQWFKSYLCNRKQDVEINYMENISRISEKFTSTLKETKGGVPQGSVQFCFCYIKDVSKPLSQTFPGYSPPPIKQKSFYQHGSKSEQVPRYPLLCRNPRNAVINKKLATMSNA
jgi:hypothetical protein